MKIGILTYHRSINYGAFVQAYVLQKLISECIPDAKVEIIDYDSPMAEKYYRRYYLGAKSLCEIAYIQKQRKVFFNAKRFQSCSDESLISNDLNEFKSFVEGKYDIIVVGSDEVWNITGMRGFPNAYWLPNIKECKKLAYAVSARNRITDIKPEDRDKIYNFLEEFDFISLRDEVSFQLINEILGEKKEIHHMCDPTMAYDFEFDKQKARNILTEKFGVNPDETVIGVMDEVGEISRYLRAKYKDSVQIISLYKYVKGMHNSPDINPMEWIQVIGSLDGLLTSFFHGMCIAINAGTPFRIFEYRNVSEAKMSKSYDLLSQYGFDDHYFQMNQREDFRMCVDEFIKDHLEKKRDNYTVIKNGERVKFEIFKKALVDITK